MVCVACRHLSTSTLCHHCRGQLQPGPDRLLGVSLRVVSAFAHIGPARALVHNFKYRGVEPAGRLLAEAMAPLLPPAVALVPLPRVDWRVLRYGLEPARFLVAELSKLTGLPAADLLKAPAFSQDQARKSRSDRIPPMFAVRRLPSGPLVLIDDVVTTGGTLSNARLVLGSAVTMALTATGSPG